ncbi:MAG: biopolymer transporter ExbD [Chthoniobacterales bacterium]|nr:biopolymer transporter ExbD [Chthoniobacterales bacterium]
MKFYQKTRHPPVPMILPLIDILAILLVFFIVTTTFKKPEPRIKIRLPESATATEDHKQRSELIVLTVLNEQNIELNGRHIKLEDLIPTLRSARETNPQKAFALKADRQAPFGLIVKIMDALRIAGIPNVSAFAEATQNKEQPQK